MNLTTRPTRYARKLLLLAGAGALSLAILAGPGALVAGADSCSAGSQSCATIAPSPGTGSTYADQTGVQIVVPANTDFTPGQTIDIVECADPGGTAANLPTDDTSCDGLTVNGDTVYVRGDGDFTESSYTLYSLPSSVLKEGPSYTPVCNATNACVLFIGQDYTNFSLPHVFSQPFYMTGGVPPVAVPESHFAIEMPLSALVVLTSGGGLLVWRRRRHLVA
jgi:hypothetical protein